MFTYNVDQSVRLPAKFLKNCLTFLNFVGDNKYSTILALSRQNMNQINWSKIEINEIFSDI